MKKILLTVLATASLSSLFSLSIAPASACTPHPDNPDGCNDWPFRRINPDRFQIKKPFPWPVCLSCPTSALERKDLVINESRLQNQGIQTEIQHLNPKDIAGQKLQR